MKTKKYRVKNSIFSGRGDCYSDEVLRSISVAVSNRRRRLRAYVKKKISSIKHDIFWQGRRDSNTQPAVLETAALPIEPLP